MPAPGRGGGGGDARASGSGSGRLGLGACTARHGSDTAEATVLLRSELAHKASWVLRSVHRAKAGTALSAARAHTLGPGRWARSLGQAGPSAFPDGA